MKDNPETPKKKMGRPKTKPETPKKKMGRPKTKPEPLVKEKRRRGRPTKQEATEWKEKLRKAEQAKVDEFVRQERERLESSGSNKKEKTIQLYYKPYDKQINVHVCQSRYKAVCCGRRVGKTLCAVYECLQKIKNHSGGQKLQIGWVAPNYQNTLRGIDAFRKVARDLIENNMVSISKTPPYQINLMGHKIFFLTADNPSAIRGFYFDFLVIDEAAFIDDSVYYDVLKPTLMDKSGELLAISTPQGQRGFFYELYLLGLNDEIKNTSSFAWTTYDNPYIANEDVDDMKRSLPNITFRQEVLAEFVSSDNQVLQSVSNCFDMRKCKCGSLPVIGCDLAKKVDYTVMVTLCPECLTVRNVLRHNQIPWGEQQQKITSEYKTQRARKMYMDATGIGDVVIDNLKGNNLSIVPVIFTNKEKNKMINDLIVHIEQGKLRWDNSKFPILGEELLSLERTITKTSVSYQAATNATDDAVMAMALALKGALEGHEYHIFSLDNESAQVDIEMDTTDESMWDDIY